MQRLLLKSKIHRATVTDANLEYIGSLTIDSSLMEKAGIIENEKVLAINFTNGQRFETYAIKGREGEICVNGGAARLCQIGDIITVCAFGIFEENEAINPKIISVNAKNMFEKYI